MIFRFSRSAVVQKVALKPKTYSSLGATERLQGAELTNDFLTNIAFCLFRSVAI
jgi:hypothetical protein